MWFLIDVPCMNDEHFKKLNAFYFHPCAQVCVRVWVAYLWLYRLVSSWNRVKRVLHSQFMHRKRQSWFEKTNNFYFSCCLHTIPIYPNDASAVELNDNTKNAFSLIVKCKAISAKWTGMAIVHKRRWDLHLICIKVHIIRTAAHQSVNEI